MKATDPSTPSSEVAMPVVSGNKADRQPIKPKQDPPAEAETVALVHVPSTEQGQVTPPQPAPQEAANSPPRDTFSRHRRDAHDQKATTSRRNSRATRQSKKPSDNGPTKPIIEVKEECRSDGLDALLRKLNLSPPCE